RAGRLRRADARLHWLLQGPRVRHRDEAQRHAHPATGVHAQRDGARRRDGLRHRRVRHASRQQGNLLRHGRLEELARLAVNNVVVSLKHRVMVMPFDASVMAVVPGTKTLPDGRIAVPHTEDTTKLVRNLGYTAPAPVLCYYDWNNDTPFATQKVTAALLSMNERA